MVGRTTAIVACLLASVASPVVAAEKIYAFSGKVNFASLFDGSTNPDWGFADGQTFTGTFGYDADRITNSIPGYISDPNWTLSYYFSPLTSLTYTIQTQKGAYSYSVPITTLGGAPATAVLVASGTTGWNGTEFRASNYPASWTGQPPVPVPGSAYVGPYYPHSTFLSFTGMPGVLNSTAPNFNLDALLAQLGSGVSGNFSVRFSDPSLWPPGQEHIDGIVLGNVERISLISAVPEPSTWLMMILGVGVVGLGLRARRASGTLVRA
jgi:hypothetical protein